jgi:uncharacterized membrane protein
MKLQIGAIFEAAYKFLFANILAIIGIAWLPYLVAIGISAIVLVELIPPQLWQGNFSHMSDADMWVMILKMMVIGPIVTVVWIVTSAMVTVGIQRRALGLARGPVFVYFLLDETVWRLVAANLLFFAAIIGIMIGVVLACTLSILAARALLSPSSAVLIGVLVGGTAYCAFFYIVIRWAFLIAPVVVAEGHIGLARAWQLASGNFWRIFAILILVTLPISIVGGMVSQIFVTMVGGTSLTDLPQHATTAQTWAAIHQLLFAALPATVISSVAQMIALSAVNNGARALAYRELSGTQPPGN